MFDDFWLYLIEILHQTTTAFVEWLICRGCILSKFYIKPQLVWHKRSLQHVVSYRNSTSNHNFSAPAIGSVLLYLIEILHQTTTYSKGVRRRTMLYLIEILHQTTTFVVYGCFRQRLYLIEILHQTTTNAGFVHTFFLLYLIEILHQTTTSPLLVLLRSCCILSKFYIKPQPGK